MDINSSNKHKRALTHKKVPALQDLSVKTSNLSWNVRNKSVWWKDMLVIHNVCDVVNLLGKWKRALHLWLEYCEVKFLDFQRCLFSKPLTVHLWVLMANLFLNVMHIYLFFLTKNIYIFSFLHPCTPCLKNKCWNENFHLPRRSPECNIIHILNVRIRGNVLQISCRITCKPFPWPQSLKNTS